MPGPGVQLVGAEEEAEVLDVLRSGFLTRYGPDDDRFPAKVRSFENAVRERIGVPFVLAMSSGTSALWTLLKCMGIGDGDEVIVPGFTFVASISAIVYAGAVPVLAEIDDSLNLDPRDVESRIGPRTKAILAVHMLGNPARLDELSAVAQRKGVVVVEDAAQAFGGSYAGRALGTLGVAGAYSFNAYKTITCGDGGMLVTSDEDLYRQAFALHDQGHLPLRNGVEVGSRPFLGLNFRMTELSGAVLLAQLRKLDDILRRLRENKALFKSLIADLPGIRFRHLPDPAGDIATHLVVRFPSETVARAVAADLGAGVLADSGWHIYNHMEHLLQARTAGGRGPWAAGSTPYVRGMLPKTDRLVSEMVSIGIGVADPNLGSMFGVGIRDGEEQVRLQAAKFGEVVRHHLGG